MTIFDQCDLGEYVIRKADIRFRTPNSGYIPPEASHTIEHLLADCLYRVTADLDGEIILDLSPMGCLTGFYCTFITEGPMKKKGFWESLIKECLTYDEIPGAAPVSCGNCKMHSMDLAKAELETFLVEFKKRDSVKVNVNN